MKKFFVLIAAISILDMSAQAGFGGSRSSGGFRSSSSFSRSSSGFGGARSAPSRSVTITRPSAPSYSQAPSRVENHYHDSGSHTNGLVTGMVLGSMMNQNHTTVVSGGGGVLQTSDPPSGVLYSSGAGTVTATPVVYESHGFFYYLFWSAVYLLAACCFFGFIFWLFNKEGSYE